MIPYRKKKSRMPFFITVGILVLLIFFSDRNPNTVTMPSKALNLLISPVNRVFYGASSGLQAAYEGIFGAKATKERVAQLEQQNQALEESLRTMETVIQQSAFLQDEYDLLTVEPDRYVAATITAKEEDPAFVRFTIDVGSNAGIRVGDTVVEGVRTEEEGKPVSAGLVGRVTEVGLNYSKVSSILDISSNISFLGTKTGDYGILNQRDEENLYGYTMEESAAISVGDSIVTSGLGGVYPRGIYVGRVSDVRLSDDELTKRITVSSPIDFFRLYRVLVLRAEEAPQTSEMPQSSDTTVSSEAPAETEVSGE